MWAVIIFIQGERTYNITYKHGMISKYITAGSTPFFSFTNKIKFNFQTKTHLFLAGGELASGGDVGAVRNSILFYIFRVI